MGKLYVLEGLDGSGKSTQFECLDKILGEKMIRHKAISFPDYCQPSSEPVKMYLGGQISQNADDVNAYAASSFYAVDRYISYKKFWEADYAAGKLILASRYVSSNAIYQMAKLPRDKWDGYLDWLCNYEYELMELPRPDRVVFLDMDLNVSQKLLSSRYEGDNSKRDIHEVNIGYLSKCREAAYYSANKLGWDVLKCSDENEPYPVGMITDSLLSILKI